MQTVTIDKETLLQKIKENREIHIKEYELALKNYPIKVKEMVTEFANNSIKLAEEGKQIGYFTYLQLPESHVKDYDLTIEMIEVSVKDQIVLTNQEFKQFFRDDWSWKEIFAASTSFYNSK